MELLQELLVINGNNDKRLIIEAMTLEKGAAKVGLSLAAAKKWSEKWKAFARKNGGVNSAKAFPDFKEAESTVIVNKRKQFVSDEKRAELAKVFKLIQLIYLASYKVQEGAFDTPPMPRRDAGKAEHKARLDKLAPAELLSKIKKDAAEERGTSDLSAGDIKGHAERTATRLGHKDKGAYWEKIKHLVEQINEGAPSKLTQALSSVGYHGEVGGRDKNGNYVFRRGYFYRMGKDHEGHTKSVISALDKLGLKHTVVDHGDKWAPFRGSAPTSKSSHFYTVVKLDPEQIKAIKIDSDGKVVK